MFFRLASGLTNDGWQLWIEGAGLTGNHALPSAAPYGDGIPNALKYAFNMNGSGPDDRRLTPGTGVSGLPVLWLDRQGPAPVARFEFVRRKNRDLTYTPKQSIALSSDSWAPMTGTTTVTAIALRMGARDHREPRRCPPRASLLFRRRSRSSLGSVQKIEKNRADRLRRSQFLALR